MNTLSNQFIYVNKGKHLLRINKGVILTGVFTVVV